MTFEKDIRAILDQYEGSPFAFSASIEEQSATLQKLYSSALKKIIDTIIKGPAQFAGGGAYSVFTDKVSAKELGVEGPYSKLGYLGVPEELWRDLTLFSHWIEPRVIFEWHDQLARFNPDKSEVERLHVVLKSRIPDLRQTHEIRAVFKQMRSCVWSGESLKDFAVDHLLPFSLLSNNDLWNLCPASPRLNIAKSDKVPSLRSLEASREKIIACWKIYSEKWPTRFWRETERALGAGYDSANPDFSFSNAFRGLSELAERLAHTRGASRWDAPSIEIKVPIKLVAESKKPFKPKAK